MGLRYAGAYSNLLRPDDDDDNRQCQLIRDGIGPVKGHCRSCEARLRPPRPYRTYDEYGFPIVCNLVTADD